MSSQTGNLAIDERSISALFGLGLSVLAMKRGSPVLSAVIGVAGALLFARAAAGHCALKATAQGHSTLREGFKDQWQRLKPVRGTPTQELPGSPAHAQKSDAVDESSSQSFPASDPPASRLPDEPPTNAAAKWAAAEAAATKGDNY